MPTECIYSGKVFRVIQDGLFETVYCLCGMKILADGLERIGRDNKYVRIPEHKSLFWVKRGK